VCKQEISSFVEWTGDYLLLTVRGQAEIVVVRTAAKNT